MGRVERCQSATPPSSAAEKADLLRALALALSALGGIDGVFISCYRCCLEEEGVWGLSKGRTDLLARVCERACEGRLLTNSSHRTDIIR